MSKFFIFVSYSHEDNWCVKEGPHGLIPWLARQLEKDGVEFWYDYALAKLPGEDFRKRIEAEIDGAHLAIVLISQDFVNSTFVQECELARIRHRVENGEMMMIPILVGPVCDDDLDWLATRQMLPGKPTPLVDYTESDIHWRHVRVEILKAVKYRIQEAHAKSPPAVKAQEPTPSSPREVAEPILPSGREIAGSTSGPVSGGEKSPPEPAAHLIDQPSDEGCPAADPRAAPIPPISPKLGGSPSRWRKIFPTFASLARRARHAADRAGMPSLWTTAAGWLRRPIGYMTAAHITVNFLAGLICACSPPDHPPKLFIFGLLTVIVSQAALLLFWAVFSDRWLLGRTIVSLVGVAAYRFYLDAIMDLNIDTIEGITGAAVGLALVFLVARLVGIEVVGPPDASRAGAPSKLSSRDMMERFVALALTVGAVLLAWQRWDYAEWGVSLTFLGIVAPVAAAAIALALCDGHLLARALAMPFAIGVSVILSIVIFPDRLPVVGIFDVLVGIWITGSLLAVRQAGYRVTWRRRFGAGAS